ncbi:MAG: restriction endonuclease subunit S, partial [Flavobacterium sp.]
RVDLKNDGLYVDENAHNFLKNSELFGGEMLIANVGAYAGLVKIMPHLKGKYTLAPNMFLLRLNQNSEFFYHQLNAPFCAEQLKMMAVSSAQPKLNKDNMRQLKVVKPPIGEQDILVKHIVNETGRIDNLLFNVKQEIELLKEFKTALISEVVTGRVDVRNEILN